MSGTLNISAPIVFQPVARPRQAPGQYRVAYVLLILVTCNLFVRPLELVPALRDIRIHQILTGLCLLILFPAMVRELNWRGLIARPAMACVVAIVPAIILTALRHFTLWGISDALTDLLPGLILFLSLVIVVRSMDRLHLYCVLATLFICVTASLALLQYYGIADLNADEYGITTLERSDYVVDPENDDANEFAQLQASGIFSDPNDFALVLVSGTIFSLHFLTSSRGHTRLFWIIPLALLLFSFGLTKSRGGLLSLIAGLGVFSVTRLGWRRSILIGIFVLPVIAVVFGGRQTSINVTDTNDTAFGRVAIWYEGIQLFKTSPIFGIGYGAFVDEVGLVAHNSYVHTYTELGFIGGTIFAAAIALPLGTMRRLRTAFPQASHEVLSWRSCFLAMLVAYGVGIFSISRASSIYTYLILALAAVYCGMAEHECPEIARPLDGLLLRKIIIRSAMWFVFIYLFIRVVLTISG